MTARNIPITPALRAQYDHQGPPPEPAPPPRPIVYVEGVAWLVAAWVEGQELAGAKAVKSAGLDAHVPLVRVAARYGCRHTYDAARPMFPGYVLISASPRPGQTPDLRRWRREGAERFLTRAGMPDAPAALAHGAMVAILLAETELARRAREMVEAGQAEAHAVASPNARRSAKAVKRLARLSAAPGEAKVMLKRDGVWAWLERELIEARPERWVYLLMEALAGERAGQGNGR